MNSPIFKHAVESFQHGLEHYLDGADRSRKFALLHLDQAVELLLKEKVILIGKSIYKSNGSTLTLHEALNSLKDISIPERPRLEEVHDLRNTVQHKGLTPDAESTQFYVEVVYRFVKRFLPDELDCKLDAVIPSKYCALMEGKPLEEASQVAEVYERAKGTADPTERIILGYTAMNLVTRVLEDQSEGKVGVRRVIRENAKQIGVDRTTINTLLKRVFDVRNNVVHTGKTPTTKEADDFLEDVGTILKMLHCIE